VRAELAILLIAAGCAESHPLADSGPPIDAWMGADAGPADSPPDAGRDAPCADGDGDGFAAASCGGDDCDDADPSLSPTSGPCVGPTEARRCVSGAVAVVPCPAGSPACDARTGACEPTACGDSVTHAGEDCDDGDEETLDGCDPDCRFGVCFAVWQCPLPAAPYCVPDGDRRGRCAPGTASGSANGEPCSVDSDCATSYCDPTQARCSEFCALGSTSCDRPGAWCGVAGFQLYGGGGATPYRCEYECSRASDCPAGSGCALLQLLQPEREYVVSACRPATGARPAGAACSGAGQCASDICLDGVCTLVCATDADCPAALPSCRQRDFSATGLPVMPRPAEWGNPWPSICGA
jgi:cysteine-rich repeat protein